MQNQQTLSAFSETRKQDTGSTSTPPHRAATQSPPRDQQLPLHPPDTYPKEDIQAQKAETTTYELCIPDGTVTPTFAPVAGSGGMGPTGIDNPEEILSITQQLHGAPIILSGGGMSMPGGSGRLFAQLLDSEQIDQLTNDPDAEPSQSIRISCNPLYRQQGDVRRDERSAVLGSYSLSVPVTREDSMLASQALSAWTDDRVEYLSPESRAAAARASELMQTLTSLTLGDCIQTPAYKTPLTVISELHHTHVRISRMTGDDKLTPVSSVILNNPRGGTYQFGFQTSRSSTDPPTCYLGRSRSTPPTPNTSFRRDSKFSATRLKIVSSTNNLEPEQIVSPDTDIQESPLPEPCLRVNLSDIEGIGDKTARKAFSQLGTTDAHELAYNLYGSGNDIPKANIVRVFDGLPSKSAVLNRLKEIVEEIDEPTDV